MSWVFVLHAALECLFFILLYDMILYVASMLSDWRYQQNSDWQNCVFHVVNILHKVIACIT